MNQIIFFCIYFSQAITYKSANLFQVLPSLSILTPPLLFNHQTILQNIIILSSKLYYKSISLFYYSQVINCYFKDPKRNIIQNTANMQQTRRSITIFIYLSIFMLLSQLIQVNKPMLEISRQNTTHNYNYFRSKLNPTTKMLIMIKGNAYGHGGVTFAKLIQELGADYIGVAQVLEAIELKENNIKLPIMVLSQGSDNYPEIIKHGFEPCIPDITSLLKLNEAAKAAGKKNFPIHIKINSGMNRIGFMQKDLPELQNVLKDIDHKFFQVKSIYTHLAATDEPQHDQFTLGQIHLYSTIFDRLCQSLTEKPMKHCLNSGGTERFTQYQFDMVRIGIGIYGISAVDQSLMKPSAAYKTQIIQLYELNYDEGTVGYGRRGKLRTEGKTKIAVLSVGYADGVSRTLSRGKGKFEVNGKLAPVLGNVCMDMCMIDVTDIEGVKLGDSVTIFGQNPTVGELAEILETIPHQIFTSIARRVKKVVVLPDNQRQTPFGLCSHSYQQFPQKLKVSITNIREQATKTFMKQSNADEPQNSLLHRIIELEKYIDECISQSSV